MVNGDLFLQIAINHFCFRILQKIATKISRATKFNVNGSEFNIKRGKFNFKDDQKGRPYRIRLIVEIIILTM